jgi:hypothetical protein
MEVQACARERELDHVHGVRGDGGGVVSLLRWAASVCFVLAALGLFVDVVEVKDGLAIVALGLTCLALAPLGSPRA